MKVSQIASILSLAALVLASLPAHATSVVCIRFPDSMGIAADSRFTVRGGAVRNDKPPGECKIIRAGKLLFSMTGFVKDPARSYDAGQSVTRALEGSENFQVATAAVTDMVTLALKKEVVRLRAEEPKLYEHFIETERGSLLEVLLVGFEEGTPKGALLGFKTASSSAGDLNVAVDRVTCPGNCDQRGVTMFVLGDRRPIDAFLKSGKASFQGKGPEEIAKQLVDIVIAAHTPDVGPPVDVLRMDKDGATWIDRKEECQ
ncbi:MAG TPA: hypothetical protein VMJ66_02970 [Geobacteraceae bacterium]|nr:hypothetical protein [Geobacteraceae bacterium]